MGRIAVSSIAWAREEETGIAAQLSEMGVQNVELAPTKIWEDPTQATDNEVSEVMKFWEENNQEVVAFQSMLFGRENLTIFGDESTRRQTAEYLKDFIHLAGRMGVKVLVFGSPKNRQRGEMHYDQAFDIATDFFDYLGKAAVESDTCLCIEPNPTDYACDFVTNTQQGIQLVEAVNNPGFRLHLDIAGMTLSGDDIEQSITEAASVLQHFHVSSPQLGQVEAVAGVNHSVAAKALADIGYNGYISIEMRPGETGHNLERINKAVSYVLDTYEPYLNHES